MIGSWPPAMSQSEERVYACMLILYLLSLITSKLLVMVAMKTTEDALAAPTLKQDKQDNTLFREKALYSQSLATDNPVKLRQITTKLYRRLLELTDLLRSRHESHRDLLFKLQRAGQQIMILRQQQDHSEAIHRQLRDRQDRLDGLEAMLDSLIDQHRQVSDENLLLRSQLRVIDEELSNLRVHQKYIATDAARRQSTLTERITLLESQLERTNNSIGIRVPHDMSTKDQAKIHSKLLGEDVSIQSNHQIAKEFTCVRKIHSYQDTPLSSSQATTSMVSSPLGMSIPNPPLSETKSEGSERATKARHFLRRVLGRPATPVRHHSI